MILRNFAGVAASRLVSLASSLLTTAIIAGAIGASEFGVYARSIAIMQTAGVIGSIGLGRYLLEMIPKLEEDEVKRRVWQALVTLLLICVPVAVVVSVAVGGFSFAFDIGLGAASMTTIIVLSGSLRAVGDEGWANLLIGPAGGVLTQLALLAGIGGLWAAGVPFDAETVTVVHAGALLLVAALALLKQVHSTGLRKSTTLSLGELRRCVPYAVNQSFALVPLDIVLGSAFLTPQELGLYAIARRLGNLAGLPLQVSNVASVRRISASLGRGAYVETQNVVSRVGLLALAISTPITIVLLAIPDVLVDLAFGDEFQGSVSAVRVVVIGLFLNVCTGPCGTVLSMGGHAALVARTTAIAILATGLGIVLVGQNLSVDVLAVIVATATACRFGFLALAAKRRMQIVTPPGVFALSTRLVS